MPKMPPCSDCDPSFSCWSGRVTCRKHGPRKRVKAIPDTLINIIREIKEHDRMNPDHGVGCACHDAHAGKIRRLFEAEGLYDVKESGFRASTKSLSNLMAVFHYITRNP